MINNIVTIFCVPEETRYERVDTTVLQEKHKRLRHFGKIDLNIRRKHKLNRITTDQLPLLFEV